ncbi:hypothetical protein OL229_06515 [Neisseriaceae bacterium JH1-16]|nr:hypothetical protein [Neisseriaceae bacterium JH1-16]
MSWTGPIVRLAACVAMWLALLCGSANLFAQNTDVCSLVPPSDVSAIPRTRMDSQLLADMGAGAATDGCTTSYSGPSRRLEGMGLDLYVFRDADSANRLLADRSNPSLSNRYHTNCPARSPEASLGQAGGGFRSTCTAPQYSGEPVTYLLFSRGVCVGEVAGLAVDLAALQAKAQQLDQAMQGAALCKATPTAAQGATPPPPPVVEGGTTPVMPEIPGVGGGTTPPAPPLGSAGSTPSSPGVTVVPVAPSGESDQGGVPPWVPLAAALGGGAIANALGRALGRALGGDGSEMPLGAATAASTGDGGAATDTGPGDASSEPPPDQQPQESYRVVLSPAAVSLRGDGADSAVLIARVVSSTGRDATAESVLQFEKLSDLGDAAAVLAPGGAAATLFARLLLSGDAQQFAVRCKATVPTPTGPVTVESDSVTVTVRSANLQFALQLVADGVVGSGEGTVVVQTTLTVFGEPRNDYQVTFSCAPSPVSGIFSPGPAQSTALPVPKLVVADKSYTVSAKGTYPIGVTEVPLQDAKTVTFHSLVPELCVTPSKDQVTGDGQDSALVTITGTFQANGQPFTPLMISVDPPRLGSCPSLAAGAATTSFVAPQLDGTQDEDVVITARAKYAGDDGEVSLSGQTSLTVLALAAQLSIETDPDDGYAVANGGNQIVLKAVLRVRGQPQPATETSWEIAPADGQGRRYGAIEGVGATVLYRVPLLVATAVLSQTIKAHYRGNGLDLHAEATLTLDGMRPQLEVRLEPDDPDWVRADGKRHDVVAEAYWDAYEGDGARTQFLPKDLRYGLVDGEGSVIKKDEWVGSYQAPDGGSDRHDDVTVLVRASGRVIGDDAPAPGIEIHGDVRFTLRYPNPGCRVTLTPASVTADGKSTSVATVVPLLYGVDARSLGATVDDFAVPLSIPDLGCVSGLDRTALSAALTIFRLSNSFSLSVPGDVMVSLDGKPYHCQGVGLLQVSGSALVPDPALVIDWQLDPSPRTASQYAANDVHMWGDAVDLIGVGYRLVVTPPGWTIVEEIPDAMPWQVDGGQWLSSASNPQVQSFGLDRAGAVRADWTDLDGMLRITYRVGAIVQSATGETRTLAATPFSTKVAVTGAKPQLVLSADRDGNADGSCIVTVSPTLSLFNTTFSGGLEITTIDNQASLDPYYDIQGDYKLGYLKVVPGKAHHAVDATPSLTQQTLKLRCKFHLADEAIKALGEDGGVPVKFSVRPTGLGDAPDSLGAFAWMVYDHYRSCREHLASVATSGWVSPALYPSRIEVEQPEPDALPIPDEVPEKAWQAWIRATVMSASNQPVPGRDILRDLKNPDPAFFAKFWFFEFSYDPPADPKLRQWDPLCTPYRVYAAGAAGVDDQGRVRFQSGKRSTTYCEYDHWAAYHDPNTDYLKGQGCTVNAVFMAGEVSCEPRTIKIGIRPDVRIEPPSGPCADEQMRMGLASLSARALSDQLQNLRHLQEVLDWQFIHADETAYLSGVTDAVLLWESAMAKELGVKAADKIGQTILQKIAAKSIEAALKALGKEAFKDLVRHLESQHIEWTDLFWKANTDRTKKSVLEAAKQFLTMRQMQMYLKAGLRADDSLSGMFTPDGKFVVRAGTGNYAQAYEKIRKEVESNYGAIFDTLGNLHSLYNLESSALDNQSKLEDLRAEAKKVQDQTLLMQLKVDKAMEEMDLARSALNYCHQIHPEAG